MPLNFGEIWDRVRYFGLANKDDLHRPDSIADPIDQSDKAEFDQNFQTQIRQMRDEGNLGIASMFGGLDYLSWISAAEKSKEDRTRVYREMEANAHVSNAIDEIVYSSFNKDENEEAVSLKFNNETLSNNDNMRDVLNKEFSYIINDVLKYQTEFFKYFNEYVVTGECMLEILMPNDDGDIIKHGVVGINMLLSEQYVTIHDTNGNVQGFIIKNLWNGETRIIAEKNQMAYVDSGRYDWVTGAQNPIWAASSLADGTEGKTVRLVKSFIDNAKKPFRQLDSLEDALIIARLARAPERLVFNVASGGLPKNKAEQYLKKMINQYRKKLTYNPNTGEVDQTQNIKNIMEDFWFAKDRDGNGTTVESIQGQQNLGEIEDVDHFLNKLYQSLRIPLLRRTEEAVFEQGPGMSRAEIKFQKYIFSVLQRFKGVINQLFKQHLIMKGIWDHYNLSDGDLDCDPVPPSYFTYLKNSEVLEAQFARFANFSGNIDTEQPLFAKETALRMGLGWTPAQIQENEKALREEQTERVEAVEDGEEGEEGQVGGGGDDFGGDIGGGLEL